MYTNRTDEKFTEQPDGQRISKASTLIHLIGNIDEFNAHLGVLKNIPEIDKAVAGRITTIQNQLYEIMGMINSGNKLRKHIEPVHAQLKQELDRLKNTCKINEFVVPGSSMLDGHFHLSRTVCRRVERSAVILLNENADNTEKSYPGNLVSYFNILGSILFYWSLQEKTPEKPQKIL